jgi:glycosyltransferase involved in cell wall biosynthesis
MKLNIIYHIYKNSTTLRDSLTSIFNQSDANFELTLINDSASNSVKNIIKEFDFSKLKKITYFKYSQNLGHSISFNQAVETTTSEYVIYVGSNFIPEENFVKTINNIIAEHSQADVISLNPVQNNGTCQTFNKINAKMKLMIGYSMKDKIFSVKFLRDNKITLNENLYSPLLLIYTVLEKFHE